MRKRRNNIIYKITNVANGKEYYGLTTQGLARRKGEHRYRLDCGRRTHKLYQAMRKYGFEKFKFETVCTALKKEYLPELEIAFIKKANSYERGYNSSPGGDAVSEETSEKLSRIFKGRKITWHDKIVASRKANLDNPSPKDFVPKGRKNPTSKWCVLQHKNGSVICVKGLRQYCLKKGFTHSNLFATANGGQNYHKNYRILGTFIDYPGTEYLRSVRSGKWVAPQVGGDIVRSAR